MSCNKQTFTAWSSRVLPALPFSASFSALKRHIQLPKRVLHPLKGGGVSATATTIEAVSKSQQSQESVSKAEGSRINGHAVVLNGSDTVNAEGRDSVLEDNRQWHETAFPSYLQSEKDDFCQDWDEALQDVERRQSLQSGILRPNAVTSSNPVWQAMRKEASRDAANEPLLSSFLYASILSHDNFLECLAFVLANRLSDPTMLATEYYEAFLTVFKEKDEIVQSALDDIQAVRERDPACGSYSNALLFYKGYQAIQVHRIAHHLWNLGQRISARNLQSRVSEVFSVDIHPQAKFGKGILMDHGTGIVVGQTAVVGNNVSILQNVTLGGTGKSDGDRHPKISDNVLIGAGATILGNIKIGKGAMVAAGSLVLKPVPPKTMVAGSPAKEVGTLTGNPALKMQHWLKTINMDSDPFCEPFEDMMQSKTQEQPDNKPVAITAAQKHAKDKQKAGPDVYTATSSPAEGESSRPAQEPQIPAEASGSRQDSSSASRHSAESSNREQPHRSGAAHHPMNGHTQHLRHNAAPLPRQSSSQTSAATRGSSFQQPRSPSRPANGKYQGTSQGPEPEYYL